MLRATATIVGLVITGYGEQCISNVQWKVILRKSGGKLFYSGLSSAYI